MKYADSLKRMLSTMMNIEVSMFENRDFKEFYYFNFNTYQLLDANKQDVPNTLTDKSFNRELKRNNLNVATEYTLSVRQILQFFGTDIIRKFFGNEL
ncbi:hypothetical protein [Clostridium sp.]|uniref:hypothetical protein n=1 Tax=Clostridium sp. TaxID=1506 RepID=UPI002FC6C405